MNASKNKRVEETITRLMHRVEGAKDWLVTGVREGGNNAHPKNIWPPLPGAYATGTPHGQIAVCTLASHELFAPLAKLPGVAIAGRVYSANLGIEKMIANVVANPSIRFLLVCGKESPYFRTGQALSALFTHGVASEGRIMEATGHMPVLSHIDITTIERFRKQVELVNCIGETNIEKLTITLQEFSSRKVGIYQGTSLEQQVQATNNSMGDGFKPVRLGGHRESLAYDPKGFFIITLDRQVGEILVHHYGPDHSPAHVVQGRNGEAILLALLREELISQKSHAGYLGAELAKAETALHLDLFYEQDRPLRLHQDVIA